MRHAVFGSMLALLAAAAAATCTPPETLRFAPDEQRAVAAELDRDLGELLLIARHEVTLPLTDRRYRVLTVVDLKGPRPRHVALDAAMNPVDLAKAKQAERDARRAKYRALEPRLHELVEQLDEDDPRPLPVLIKFRSTQLPVPDKTGLDSRAALRAAAEWRARAKGDQERFVRQAFRKTVQGLVPPDHPIVQSVDFVRTELPAAAIRRLRDDDRIQTVMLGIRETDTPEEIDDLEMFDFEHALQVTGTDHVHTAGVRGMGVRIGVVEWGAIPEQYVKCVDLADGDIKIADAVDSLHMTKSVAIIRNRFADGDCAGTEFVGYAPAATVRVGNEGPLALYDYLASSEWLLLDPAAHILSISWQYDSELTTGVWADRDLYFDQVVTRPPWPTVFTAAGSIYDFASTHSCGKGFNVMAVADVAINATLSPSDDSISVLSPGTNPESPHGDREVPEIAAPGSRHAVLDVSYGGTSAATPAAAGIAALLMSANSKLLIWPEAIRAILLATARHDIDGVGWQDAVADPAADTGDGAGMIDAMLAHQAAIHPEPEEAAPTGYATGSLAAGQAAGTVGSWEISTPGPRTVRAALAWSNNTIDLSGELEQNLDLIVIDKSGDVVGVSATMDNSYEIVTFTTEAAGTFTVVATTEDAASSLTYYAIAWTTFDAP